MDQRGDDRQIVVRLAPDTYARLESVRSYFERGIPKADRGRRGLDVGELLNLVMLKGIFAIEREQGTEPFATPPVAKGGGKRR